ncbi:MAG: VanZ family protein [Candidatus Tectomicrobia bacterium]|uniref:VanZ family protein n=1 Tax=Tectimicrobiota bacterium TaxID=2528274 RepID=A0A932CMN0_UNCTE|nr:VanZ family protein [Candidatus Tectomicrobia bacterium]
MTKIWRIIFLVATLAWMGFILYLSSQPSSFYEEVAPWMRRFHHLMEYPAHFFLYSLLFQFSRGLLFSLSGPQGRRKALGGAVLLTSGFGIIDELYQSTVPTRHCDPRDFLVDSLAALTGVLLSWFFSHRFAGVLPASLSPAASSELEAMGSIREDPALGHRPSSSESI